MGWKKPLIAVLGAAAAAGGLVWALLPSPVPVEIAQVTRGTFQETVEEDGKTRVRDRYVVSAPLVGRLQRITLKAGDKVREGMVVALLAPTVPGLLDIRVERELTERVGAAEAARLRAAAAVARAQTALEQAKADLDRSRRLAERGFVAPSQLDQATLTVKLAIRDVELARQAEHTAEHDVAVARAALLTLRQEPAGEGQPARLWEVRSPVSGEVLKVVQESEGVVVVGAPLLEIGNPADLEVVADVLTTDAVRVAPGMPVVIERWGGGEDLQGRVRLVEPSAFTKISALGVEEQRVNVVIDLVSPPARWRSLGDGYRIDARIITATVPNAVKVPVSALFREGEQWSVFVVTGGRAHKRSVRISGRNGLEAMVEKGLEPGEQVIAYPGDTVKDGVRVKPRS
jgi:HlyD family secretion protein